MNKTWRIDERSFEKAELSLNEEGDNKKHGYKNLPLMRFLAFKKAIVDPLHLCLRITDVVFQKLWRTLNILMAIYLMIYQNVLFLKGCGIFVKQHVKSLLLFTLTKLEKKLNYLALIKTRLKILKYLNFNNDLLSLFPELDKVTSF